MESCSDSLSECGSIEIASPWLANLKVSAETAVATSAAPRASDAVNASLAAWRPVSDAFIKDLLVNLSRERHAPLGECSKKPGPERDHCIVEIISGVVQETACLP